MSTEKLQWQFELLDKISGPANGAVRSLNQLNQAMNQLNVINLKVSGSMTRSTSGLESWVTKLSSVINVGRTVIDVIEGITGAVGGMTRGFVGSVLEQAKFHAKSMTTLGVLLRNEPGGARREFSAGIRLGRVLPGSTRDVLQSRVGIAGAGFTDRGQRDRMFALQQDLSALSMNDDADTPRRATKLISDIRAAGRLKGQELNQLAELGTGVGRADLFREIGASRGLRGSESSVSAQVQALVSNGEIKSDEALSALQRAVVGKTGLSLGGFAYKQGTSLVGQLSNAESMPQTILQTWFNRQQDTMSSGGMSAFGNFLKKFNDFFAEGTPSGERFLAVVDKLINGVFGSLFGNDPTPLLTQLLDVIERAVPVASSMLDTFRTLGASIGSTLLPMLMPLVTAFGNLGSNENMVLLFQRFGQALGFVGGMVGWFFALFALGVPTIVGGLVELGAKLFEWATSFGQWFMSIGAMLMTGLAEGIRNTGSVVWEAIKGIGNGALSRFLALFGIHSPSRVMMGVGAHLGEGLALGIEGTGSRVDRSMSGLLAPSSSLGDFGAGRGGGAMSQGAIQVTLNFTLPDHATDAQAIAAEVRPMVETALAEVVERMAISAGAY